MQDSEENNKEIFDVKKLSLFLRRKIK